MGEDNFFLAPNQPKIGILLLQDPKNFFEEELQHEFIQLCRDAGTGLCPVFHAKLKTLDTHRLVGKGTMEAIHTFVLEHKIHLLIVNRDMTPGQEKVFRKALSERILDRTGLILDIFSQRAVSYEGKLQVEMAQLNYMGARLVGEWKHLERQKGGIGLRGPGETQLETDKRLIGKKKGIVKKKLEKITYQRLQRRRNRRRNNLVNIALVGYTNVGKSTIFNILTNSRVSTGDKFFQTLEPKTRNIHLGGMSIAISDTVGFIRQLPETLIDAFTATMLEVRDADILVLVEDISSSSFFQQRENVFVQLEKLGALKIPRISVLNKIDAAPLGLSLTNYKDRETEATVVVQALHNQGIDTLKQVLLDTCNRLLRVKCRLIIPLGEAVLRSGLYRNAQVVHDYFIVGLGWRMDIIITPFNLSGYRHFLVKPALPSQDKSIIS